MGKFFKIYIAAIRKIFFSDFIMYQMSGSQPHTDTVYIRFITPETEPGKFIIAKSAKYTAQA